MVKNTNIIGIAAILLLLASLMQDSSFSKLGLNGPLRFLEAGSMLDELHRLTNIINRMDNFGQMALNPPQAVQASPLNGTYDISGLLENIAPIASALGILQNEHD